MFLFAKVNQILKSDEDLVGLVSGIRPLKLNLEGDKNQIVFDVETSPHESIKRPGFFVDSHDVEIMCISEKDLGHALKIAEQARRVMINANTGQLLIKHVNGGADMIKEYNLYTYTLVFSVTEILE